MGPNQPATEQGMAHPSVWSSQALGCGCVRAPVPAEHQQHQCIDSQIGAFLTGSKSSTVESSHLLLPERLR